MLPVQTPLLRSCRRHLPCRHIPRLPLLPSLSARRMSMADGSSTAAAAGSSGSAERLDWEAYNTQWTDIWRGGLQKGERFDAGKPSPLLSYLFTSGSLDPVGKRAIIPGCGRGYDVVAFAEAGASCALGLDIVPEAVAAAEAECSALVQHKPAAVAAAMRFATADFFTYSDAAGQFDVGYDYTFLCALHPDMRKDWAEGWGRLLAPGGTLVTLVYPVDPSREGTPGPPWPVTPQLYQQLLLPAGFEQVRLEQMPAAWSHPARAGREWLGVWRWKAAAASSQAAGEGAPGSKI